MSTIPRIGLTLLVAGAAVSTVAAIRGRGTAEPPTAPPAAPEASRVALVHAQPFHLDEGYPHTWRAEQPTVEAGWILVVRAEPELLLTRQTHNPVLLVGEEVAEKVNDGYDSGHGVFVVPSPAGEDLGPELDLASAAITFVDPQILPEAMTLADVRSELSKAVEGGAAPPSPAAVESAVERGGGPVFLADGYELRVHLSHLIERYSPQETDLVRGLRAPLVR